MLMVAQWPIENRCLLPLCKTIWGRGGCLKVLAKTRNYNTVVALQYSPTLVYSEVESHCVECC